VKPKEDCQAIIDWLIGPEGQAAMASYKIDSQQLFFPNAQSQGSATRNSPRECPLRVISGRVGLHADILRAAEIVSYVP
jgi:hypothetical protein